MSNQVRFSGCVDNVNFEIPQVRMYCGANTEEGMSRSIEEEMSKMSRREMSKMSRGFLAPAAPFCG